MISTDQMRTQRRALLKLLYETLGLDVKIVMPTELLLCLDTGFPVEVLHSYKKGGKDLVPIDLKHSFDALSMVQFESGGISANLSIGSVTWFCQFPWSALTYVLTLDGGMQISMPAVGPGPSESPEPEKPVGKLVIGDFGKKG